MTKVPRFDEDWGGGMHPDSDGPWIRSEDYDALAARLADKEILLAEAVEYGTGYKQAYDEAMANYQMALARLAEAEALLSIAGQELLIGMIDPTATCYPQIRAFLARENERE